MLCLVSLSNKQQFQHAYILIPFRIAPNHMKTRTKTLFVIAHTLCSCIHAKFVLLCIPCTCMHKPRPHWCTQSCRHVDEYFLRVGHPGVLSNSLRMLMYSWIVWSMPNVQSVYRQQNRLLKLSLDQHSLTLATQCPTFHLVL